MKTKISLFAFVAFSALFFMQCKKTAVTNSTAPILPESTLDYHLKVIPSSNNNNTPNDNQITNDGATLGRVLFYDPKLSINNQTSCGSCHLQSNGFADNKSASIGFEGNKTSRNSSTIINVINQSSYFWDKRTDKLETMVLQPIRHQVEMGMEKSSVLPKKLATISYYAPLFKKAFGTEEITADRISKALSQFLRSMTSYDSKADQTMLMQGNFGGWGQTNDPRVTPAEKRGAMLFSNAGCTSCHSGNNLRGWNDEGEANIGLELNYTDKGLGETDATKVGMFKIPSLRNVALTAPYMHDGRFKTLKEVINHYNAGVVDHPNLSSVLRNNAWNGSGDNSPRKLNLTDGDINDLVAFLTTLTDESIISDAKFSDPFRK